MQVFEVFVHILGTYDDLIVEHGHSLLETTLTQLHVHAKCIPLAELKKLSLSTVRSDTHLRFCIHACFPVLVAWSRLTPGLHCNHLYN